MGSIWPWVIGGVVVIGGYFLVVRPWARSTLSDMTQQLKQRDPKKWAEIRAKDPQMADKMLNNSWYVRSGYRY